MMEKPPVRSRPIADATQVQYSKLMIMQALQRARGRRLYVALRWVQLFVAALLVFYQAWKYSHGRHTGDEGPAGLVLMALVGILAEIVRRRSGLAFTWSGLPK